MARTKEFDPDAALQRALDLFWERGYEATSMSDIVEHLGIGRASIYATFGSKHELYVKALARYMQARDQNPVELLSQPGPALPAIRSLIQRYADESAQDKRRRGCMVVNAASELVPGDEQVARFVESSWASLEAALTSALIRARAQHEIAPETDPRTLARFILVFLQGIRVIGKGSASPDRVQDAAAQAIALLH
ncbi:TetR/AcrR family transcriptional regulator [Phytoactinopolyspora alkaliphila]|uniref:TetR/AcrR family transcriptional regulator n=1 Tax=Phytoactinopolyspora alkaliphila TaxID=1783498 RepID=A0A6N9YJZ2_9ACTN|nr:TetR/AcrR family transcriptional regulator [Phytoactinopolyspora alkaliphila]NED95198.1 TetR/AcrR family transcriptional regulator [Phytoactinopolyspora alkaliphila]